MSRITNCARIPSRRRRRRSRRELVGQVVQRMRCFTWPTSSGPLRGKLADATGYPLPARPVLRQSIHPAPPVILVRAPCVPVPTGTHGNHRS
jgi:hypothetical protein